MQLKINNKHRCIHHIVWLTTECTCLASPLSPNILVFRLVELDKLKQLSRKQERKETVSRILMKIVQKINVSDFLQLARVEDPDVVVIMPSSSKGGIMEKYIKVFRKPK